MRPLPQTRHERFTVKNFEPRLRQLALASVLLTAGAWTLGCGGGGAGSVTSPPLPPPSITVGITPSSGTVFLGGTLTFTATVTDTTDTAVTWSVNSISGGAPQVGTITADGLYMAPADLPPGGTIQVTATSHADSTKSNSASVTLSSDVGISVSPASGAVELGSTQSFHASITGSGHPDSTVYWSLSGSACPAQCGTMDGNGNYTAPQILPGAAIVSITATSVADPSRQSSASITITSNFTLRIAAPASLAPGVSSAIVATMTPVAGSQPNANLSWSLSGAGCSGSACSTLTVTTTQSAGANPISDTANYIAPSLSPQPETVFITVTPQADPSKKVQATVTILGGTGISLSPITETIAANLRFALTASVSGLTNTTLNWSINGIAGGNAIFGQICVAGSNPCQVLTSSSASQVDYLAPGAIPWPNPFSIVASSASNSLLTASTPVTVINHILVSVQPHSVTLPPMGVQGFVAAVLGSTNQRRADWKQRYL
jgi:hypothetical protein